jgi:hypothetical protein
MKNLLLTVLITFFSLACNKSREKTTSAPLKSDTLVLNNHDIVFVSPGDQTMAALKKKNGEDFYTIADDAGYYFYEASVYLDSLKVSYKNADDTKVFAYKKDNKTVAIPRFKSPWYALFYKDGKYETVDLINVREEYPKFFGNTVAKSSGTLDSKTVIASAAGDQYSVVEEKDCDLNNDQFTDKIVVLANNRDLDPQDPDTKIAPVLILLNDQNKKYDVLKNEKIYPNSFGDSFRKLVVKDRFFTVELFNEVPDEYTSEKYITFKFSEPSKEVVLSKYGEKYRLERWQKDEYFMFR